MRVLEAIDSVAWAMLPEWVERIRTIAAREHDPTPEALEAYRAMALPKAERAQVRGPVVILNAFGPMFRRANLMVEFSGATSYEILHRDFQAALDNPAVRSILINVDTPGGEVNGVDELAKAIHAARGVKRIVAYVGGTGASGGYWIASAAEEVVVSDAAVLGSIGVAMAVTDTSGRDERQGIRRVEIVSSQSPDKRPDIGTDEGRARVQRTVDELAAVFVTAVAKHRGVDAEAVIARFGRGGVEVGQKAVAAGMADRIGTFEGVIAELSAAPSSRGGFGRSPQRSGGHQMSGNTDPAAAKDAGITQSDHDKAVAKAKAEAAAAAQARIKAILSSDAAKASREQAEYLAYETDMAAEAAIAILAKAPKAPEPTADETKKAEAEAYAKDRAAATAGLGAPEKPGGDKPRASLKAGDVYAARRKALAGA
jgi:signal peptide peptidase SppA